MKSALAPILLTLGMLAGTYGLLYIAARAQCP
jgi:hypothetical protein